MKRMNKEQDRVVVFGDRQFGGAYVLRMVVQKKMCVSFGRFLGGQKVDVPPGVYVYVGSAMGCWKKLGQRLARHATRSGFKSRYAIRQKMGDVFGEDVLPVGEKRLRWHVDYLLDQQAVDITHVLAICSAMRLEGDIADALLADETTHILVPGLGASDAPTKTHLLRVSGDMAWWQAFASVVKSLDIS